MGDTRVRGVRLTREEPWFPPVDGLRDTLESAVEGHQPCLDTKLWMPHSELPPKLRQRFPMGSGLAGGIGDRRRTVGNLCGATIAMVDGDDRGDSVQFDGGVKVVPERGVPILESGRDNANGCAGHGELAVPSGETASGGVVRDEFLEPRVDTCQNHCPRRSCLELSPPATNPVGFLSRLVWFVEIVNVSRFCCAANVVIASAAREPDVYRDCSNRLLALHSSANISCNVCNTSSTVVDPSRPRRFERRAPSTVRI